MQLCPLHLHPLQQRLPVGLQDVPLLHPAIVQKANHRPQFRLVMEDRRQRPARMPLPVLHHPLPEPCVRQVRAQQLPSRPVRFLMQVQFRERTQLPRLPLRLLPQPRLPDWLQTQQATSPSAPLPQSPLVFARGSFLRTASRSPDSSYPAANSPHRSPTAPAAIPCDFSRPPRRPAPPAGRSQPTAGSPVGRWSPAPDPQMVLL